MNNITYKTIIFFVKRHFEKPDIYGLENYLNDGPALFMCNHEKMYGPAIMITRVKIKYRPWAHSGVVNKDEAVKYISADDGFLRKTLHFTEFYAKVFAKILARPLCDVMMRNRAIPAYRDSRKSRVSIEIGMEAFACGDNQIIFAETKEMYEDKLRDDFSFMPGYQLLLQQTIKRKKIYPKIYPVALNRHNHSVAIGKPIIIRNDIPWSKQRHSIDEYLSDIVKLGYVQPEKMIDVEWEYTPHNQHIII